MMIAAPEHQCTLSTKVTVKFAVKWDAGALIIAPRGSSNKKESGKWGSVLIWLLLNAAPGGLRCFHASSGPLRLKCAESQPTESSGF
jgi:hypothetical protein